MRLMPFHSRLVRVEAEVKGNGERLARVDKRVGDLYRHFLPDRD